jgi:type I restriction enzyme S subunit
VKRKKNINEGLVPETYDNYQMLYTDNIVMRLIDLQNDHTSLRTGLVKETGIITSAYTCLQTKENSAYLRYLLHSYDTKKVFYGFGGGVRQSIGFKDIRNLMIPVPPRAEQDQIVRYLDWQVSKINKLIAAKKKQITSLTAEKHTVVSDVITHGLNPKAEMKFSGVEWLGDIPAHWTVVKLRGILSAVSEKGHPEMQLLSVVREQGVIVRDVEDSESNHNFIPDDLSGYKVVRKNQFAMNKMKAWQGSYGISQYDGIVSPAYFVFNVNFKNLEYFHYAIRSKVYVNFFAQSSDGIRVGQWDLSMNKMKDIPFILPPEDEQAEIVKYIPAQIEMIEKAITTIQTQIDKLHELRTRIISDVVTGQIDVRGIEIPDFEMVEETDESADEEDVSEETEEQEE